MYVKSVNQGLCENTLRAPDTLGGGGTIEDKLRSPRHPGAVLFSGLRRDNTVQSGVYLCLSVKPVVNFFSIEGIRECQRARSDQVGKLCTGGLGEVLRGEDHLYAPPACAHGDEAKELGGLVDVGG